MCQVTALQITAHTGVEDPIVLENESRLEDSRENLDATPLRALESRQHNYGAMEVDMLSSQATSNRLAESPNDGDNDVSNDDMVSLRHIETSTIPRCELDLCRANTPPISPNEDEIGSMENTTSGSASSGAAISR